MHPDVIVIIAITVAVVNSYSTRRMFQCQNAPVLSPLIIIITFRPSLFLACLMTHILCVKLCNHKENFGVAHSLTSELFFGL